MALKQTHLQTFDLSQDCYPNISYEYVETTNYYRRERPYRLFYLCGRSKVTFSFGLSGVKNASKIILQLNHCRTTADGIVNLTVNGTTLLQSVMAPRCNFGRETFNLAADNFHQEANALTIQLAPGSPGVYWLSDVDIYVEHTDQESQTSSEPASPKRPVTEGGSESQEEAAGTDEETSKTDEETSKTDEGADEGAEGVTESEGDKLDESKGGESEEEGEEKADGTVDGKTVDGKSDEEEAVKTDETESEKTEQEENEEQAAEPEKEDTEETVQFLTSDSFCVSPASSHFITDAVSAKGDYPPAANKTTTESGEYNEFSCSIQQVQTETPQTPQASTSKDEPCKARKRKIKPEDVTQAQYEVLQLQKQKITQQIKYYELLNRKLAKELE